MTARWVLLVVVACGGSAPHADLAKPVHVVATPPPPPPCITPPEAGGIVRARARGSRIEYCVAHEADCFGFDVATGKLERLAAAPEVSAPPVRIETLDPRLEICTGEVCTSLTPKVIPTATHLRAATNRDGTLAVVLLGDAPAGKGYAEVWSVARSRRLARFRYATGPFRCGEVAMLDDETIYVAASDCGQPAARAALYRLNGRKIANVGGKDFGAYGGAYVHVTGSTWAFLEENASLLAVQDVVRGKVQRMIDLAPLFQLAGAEMSNPGESALVRLDDTRLAVIAGVPAIGSVAVVDVATGGLTLMPAPLCSVREPAEL
jgi:hypothetical protein